MHDKLTLTFALTAYVVDPENWTTNFNLADNYFNIGQTAAAISFYLRAAERTTNPTLQYMCLMKMADGFIAQSNRVDTVIGLYQHCINILPEVPNAHFALTKVLEGSSRFVDSYMAAKTALQVCDFSKNIEGLGDYKGKYCIYFQQAVAAWWWGKSQEARDLFKMLADQYSDQMDEVHYQSVQNNLLRLGIGPESQGFKYYTRDKADRLKHKFDGYETIDNNFSQVYQDMFVLTMTNGKRNGTYLEIGSAGPFHGNNTALLEKAFDWKGVGIEYNPDFIPEYQLNRKNPVLCVDAMQVDYLPILEELANGSKVIDYLQLDCEPAKTTYDIMKRIPFDQYKFRVITYEHDHYVDMTGLYRSKSRQFLWGQGYVLVVNDVSPDGKSNFEDWWVHPSLVDAKLIEQLQSDNPITDIQKHMLND